MKNLFILFLCISLCGSLSAQNYFSNPDFEQDSACPTVNGNLDYATGWYDVVYSSDYINCAYTGWTPQSIAGAYHGTGYAGFATYGNANGAAESFGQPLATPLTAGSTYTINFHAKRSINNFYSSVCSGVCFWGFIGSPVTAGPQTNICAGSLLGANYLACSDTVVDSLWQAYIVSFTAAGNFDYIAISPDCALNCAEYIYIDSIAFTLSTSVPDTLTGSATSTNAACFNSCDGTAIATVTQGTPPYQFLWSPTNDTTASISNLCPGTYIVKITDAMNATLNDTVTVSAPSSFSDSVTTFTPVICASDSAYICSDPGFIAYQWNFGDTTQCIYTQLAGNYYVTVTDNNGCTVASNHVSITVHTPPAVSVSVNGDTLTAYNAVSYQWFLNGNIIPGATSQTYIATQGGNYTVEVTDTNGCAAVSSGVLISSIHGLKGDGEVNIYPNPSEFGMWNLKIGSDWLGSEIEIFDGEGRTVFKSLIFNPESLIELNIARGIYVLRINSNKNVITRKLIKL